MLFLSTLSLRRATLSIIVMAGPLMYFYPRSPCGERRVTVLGIQHRCGISIHALLAESDRPWACSAGSVYLFLSTLSLRRATANAVDQILPGHISIHALLAESDTLTDDVSTGGKIFLSTLSLRRATVYAAVQSPALRFLSTLSLRRATCVPRHDYLY